MSEILDGLGGAAGLAGVAGVAGVAIRAVALHTRKVIRVWNLQGKFHTLF